MKKVNKIFTSALSLILVVVIICINPLQVSASTVAQDLYSQNAIEEVKIDDVTYYFHYFYEDGNRAIVVTNNVDTKAEKITYNIRSATTTFYRNSTNENLIQSTSSGWVLISSESHRITWGEGMTVAAVAAAISAGLGFIGGAAVIAAMGTAALSVLAAGAVGGTLYVDTYCMTIPLQPTHYLYVWSFTASTGDSYGPYRYQPQVYYN